jgi:type VI secretion system protein ImpL
MITGDDYTASLLKFLERSALISDLFFSGEESGPRFEFDVMIHPAEAQGVQIDTIALTVDGKTETFHNASPRWRAFSWPGEGDPGARIEIKGRRGADVINDHNAQNGEWGLFRLIEHARVSSARGGVLRLHFNTLDVPVVVDLRPKRSRRAIGALASDHASSGLLALFRGRPSRAPQNILKRGRQASCRASR